MARFKTERPESSEPPALSRDVSTEYYSKELRKRSHKKIALSVLAAVVAVFACASIAIASYVKDIDNKITGKVNKNLQGVLTVQEPGKPFYLLLIGVDKDEGRVSDPEYGEDDSGYRSDSIMLTRIDPGEKKVTMVSIHRDTMYNFKEYGVEKINAAYTIGQEAFTTKTISDFAGVPISHYAEVDMDGLAAVIDCIGGIDVTLDMDIKDPYYTGLDLEKGEHHMDGETAALFCRCRHAYDAIGDGDRYRAQNQRMIISLVAKKILSSNPATIASTVSTMASYVRTDMDVSSIVTLATQFIGMDFENNIYTGMEPTIPLYVNETWYEVCDKTAWRKMMDRVDQGLPPTEEGDVGALESSEGTIDLSEYGINATASSSQNESATTDVNSYDTGYDTSYDTGYDTSYDTGYDSGYDTSYDTGYEESYDSGYDEGGGETYSYEDSGGGESGEVYEEQTYAEPSYEAAPEDGAGEATE